MAIISATEPIDMLTAIATVGPLIVDWLGMAAKLEEVVPWAAVAEFVGRDEDILEKRGIGGMTAEVKLLDVALAIDP